MGGLLVLLRVGFSVVVNLVRRFVVAVVRARMAEAVMMTMVVVRTRVVVMMRESRV